MPYRKNKTKNQRFIEVILSLIVLSPNILALFRASDLGLSVYHMSYIFYTFLLFIIPSFWFTARYFFYFQGFVLLLGIVELVHILLYDATTSLLFIHSIFLTEPREALELFISVWPIVLFIILLYGIYFWVVYRFIKPHPFYPHWARLVFGISFPIIVIICDGFAQWCSYYIT